MADVKHTRIRNQAMKAAEHHSTLCAFATVVAVLEAGVISDPAAYRTAERIRRLCLAEQQRQLRKYEAALSNAGSKS